jgi:hypothetical protein
VSPASRCAGSAKKSCNRKQICGSLRPNQRPICGSIIWTGQVLSGTLTGIGTRVAGLKDHLQAGLRCL